MRLASFAEDEASSAFAGAKRLASVDPGWRFGAA
jgi:hypothetical protein